MPVLPCRQHHFLYHNELYQFLSHCQQSVTESPQIVSVSLEIDAVDPLAVLAQISQPNQLTFYFENKNKQQAIAAIDAVANFQTDGLDRFAQAQNFIDSCRNRSITIKTSKESFTNPHFFCSFSFFDTIVHPNYPFPAATVFLPRWQINRCGDRYTLLANLLVDTETKIDELYQNFCRTIRLINATKFNPYSNQNLTSIDKVSRTKNINNLKKTISSSLKLIDAGYLRKIVLSHPLDVISEQPYNLFQSLDNLRQIHPDCSVFATSNGQQTFIGASPERLISIHNQQLNTDALAGSAPRGKTLVEDTALANRLMRSVKEQHEHRVVIDFITQSLHQLGVIPQMRSPRLRQLSNIQHLWTPIQAEVPTHVHPLEIVAKLHPTPAVAGVARDTACAKIQTYETFERGLYAAPIGWVDDQGNSEFIVGIRSALIDRDRARLYAGAGIVAGSDPDKEIAEIQLKFQALLKALV